MRWQVIWEKKVSTAFSHDPEVGVKWKIQRGWRTNQAFTLGCLWVASLSRMACTSLPAGTARSTVAIETEECAMEQLRDGRYVSGDEFVECSKSIYN
jgi:hypothetical protein